MYFYSGGGKGDKEENSGREHEEPDKTGAESAKPVAEESKNNRGLKILCIVLTVLVIISNVFTLILVKNLTLNSPKESTNDVELLGEVIAANSMNSVAKISIAGGGSTASGTGFVVFSELSSAYLVTNYHVVEKAVPADPVYPFRVGSAVVAGKTYDAYLVSGAKEEDLAVLRITTQLLKLPALTFADSGALRYGAYVLAIGNPYGEGLAVSEGCVSVPLEEQQLDGVAEKVKVIRVTAAINPGSSGGPLLDRNGKVIGVNTARRKRQDFDSVEPVAMNFAIPAVSVVRFLNEKQHNLPFYVNADGVGQAY